MPVLWTLTGHAWLALVVPAAVICSYLSTHWQWRMLEEERHEAEADAFARGLLDKDAWTRGKAALECDRQAWSESGWTRA